MPYICPEVIQEAKRLDLLTYLKDYEPQELVRLSNNVYCTKTHDSLKISNGRWYWYSRGVGGRTALDYLIKVQGMNFTEAVDKITGRVVEKPPFFMTDLRINADKVLSLPAKSNSDSRMTAYLSSRGIDRGIIRFCVNSGVLYESYPYGNAIFIGKDDIGTPKYAALRGKDFKGEAKGSDKRYSFNILSAIPSDTLHLFESPIDLLSFATLLKLHGRDWRRDNLLSLSGVCIPGKNAEPALPASLDRFLCSYPDTNSIMIRLDNDDVGRKSAQALCEVLSADYETFVKLPPYGKDYNEYLCSRLSFQLSKQRQYER